MHLNSIRIIKDPDALAPFAVIAMHDRVDDRLTQNLQGVLWNIYALPPLNTRPYRDISVEKRFGSIYQVLKGSPHILAIGIAAGTNRLSKEDAHHFPLDDEELGIEPEKEQTGVGWHHLTASSHHSASHTHQYLLHMLKPARLALPCRTLFEVGLDLPHIKIFHRRPMNGLVFPIHKTLIPQ